MRTIVYELKDGTEEVFEIDTVEMEIAERQAVEQAVRNGDCVDFRFEEMFKSTFAAIKSGRLRGVN